MVVDKGVAGPVADDGLPLAVQYDAMDRIDSLTAEAERATGGGADRAFRRAETYSPSGLRPRIDSENELSGPSAKEALGATGGGGRMRTGGLLNKEGARS
jgi:hypothetical protein